MEGDGLFEMVYGILIAFLFVEAVAEVLVGLGGLGNVEDFLVGLDRELVVAELGLVQAGQAGQAGQVLRLDLQGFSEIRKGSTGRVWRRCEGRRWRGCWRSRPLKGRNVGLS